MSDSDYESEDFPFITPHTHNGEEYTFETIAHVSRGTTVYAGCNQDADSSCTGIGRI